MADKYLNSTGLSYLIGKIKALVNSLKADTRLLKGGTRISSGDLDNYKTPGTYYISANADLSNISHVPDTHAGILLVETSVGVGTTYIRQTYTEYTTAVVHQREIISSGGAWSSWRKLPTRFEMDSALSYKGSLDSNDDLNNLYGASKHGFYNITTNVANSPENWSNLIVSRGAGDATFQMLYGSYTIYLRAYTGNPLAWTTWIKMPTAGNNAGLRKLVNCGSSYNAIKITSADSINEQKIFFAGTGAGSRKIIFEMYFRGSTNNVNITNYGEIEAVAEQLDSTSVIVTMGTYASGLLFSYLDTISVQNLTSSTTVSNFSIPEKSVMKCLNRLFPTYVTDVKAWAETVDGFCIGRTDTGSSNLPGNLKYGLTLCHAWHNDSGSNIWIRLMYFPTSSTDVYTASKTNAGSWTDWVKLPTRSEMDSILTPSSTSVAFGDNDSATLRLYKSGKTVWATMVGGTVTSEVNTSFVTVPSDYRPREATNFVDAYSGSYRLTVATNGNMVCNTALNGFSLRFSAMWMTS